MKVLKLFGYKTQEEEVSSKVDTEFDETRKIKL